MSTLYWILSILFSGYIINVFINKNDSYNNDFKRWFLGMMDKFMIERNCIGGGGCGWVGGCLGRILFVNVVC